jgi:autotransporter-associated beta strand protein
VFNGGSFTYALSFDTLVNGGGIQQWVLTPTAQPALADVWWRGDLTGLAQGVWSATLTSGTGFPSNWDDIQASATAVDALVPPDSASIVHFSSDAAANLTTTLGANMTIQELIFHTGNAPTTIGSSNGTNTLTLGNTVDAAGLTIQTGANDVGISAIVALPQNQSWNIEDTARVLTLSGGLTGTARTLTVNDTTINSGTLLFSGSAATMTGTLAINAGNLVFEDTGSLNSGLDVVLGTASKAATLFVGGSSAASLATIGGLSNGTLAGSKVVGGNATLSTLAIGPASGTTTFSGALGGGGANENQFNLVKTGAGIQIINGAVTYAGSTIVREGTLRLGTSATFTPTGSLSVIANAGATAVFDFNGKSFTTIGAITLGGGASGIAQVLDTNGTKGVITLGGDIIYDATNNPGNATISTNINTGAANRIITVGNSANSANELTISGTISAITDNNLTFNGAGSGTISGNISLAWSGGTGATNDVIFASTGTWTISAKIEVEDDIAINSGTVNANAIESLDAADDVVITGTGTQGSTIVNINSASQVHTGDDIFIRGGAIVNVNTTNGINTGTDQILIGDSGSASAAAAGVLNLAANMASTNGFVLGAASGNIGNITGTGTFTSAATKFLRNGSIESGIILAGNGAITKDAIGTVTFSGERAAASTGGTNIQEGTLILDYTTNNNSKIGGVLTLGLLGNVSNSTLALNGSNTTATVQGVTSTTIAGGNTTVAVSNGTSQTATLNLGAITRNTAGGAGVVTFEYLTNDSKATSTSAAGTLGWATLSVAAGVERFAAINGSGDIVQAALTVQNDVTQWAAGQNIISSSAFTGVVDCAHIASLTFDASAASTVSLTSTGNLVVNSGGIMVDSGVGAFASTITGGSLIGSSSGILGELVVHQNNTLGSLTIASKIINSGGITKAGLGTLILSGANTFLNTGSQLSIQEGTVQLGGGNAIGDTTAVYLRQGTTLNLNNSNEVVGHLVSNSTGTIALGTGRITFNQTTNTTYAGVFTGGAGSVITFNGPLFNFNITGSTTTGFTGGVVVNSGLLQLSGAAGRLGGALSFTINKSGTLLIDNNDDAAPNDRISDSAAFTLHSADGTPSGEVTRPRGLWIRSDNDATEDETIGALTFASGASYATLDANTTGTSAVLRLTSSGWTRTAGATINVRGRNLGATANQRTGFKIDDANDTAFMTANLVGGAGAAGTDTRSIVPWAMGENMTGGAATDTNMGNTLLTYVDNVGFVPLSFTNEYSTFAAKDSNADNIRESLTADLTSLAGQTINSLVIHNNSTAASTINVTGAGAGNALVNTSGAFLFTQNTAATASTAHSVILGGFDDGVQVGSSNEYVFFVVNPSSAATTPTLTARVDSALNTTTAAVTKSGRGTLEFTAVNTYTGGTTVNEGTLLIHDNDNIGGTGAGTQGDLNLAGGTLRLAADYTDDLGSRDLLVREGGGTIQVDAATVTATNLITTGAGTLTKTGNGTLQLAGGTANTQTGVVAVNQGTLELNKTAAINAISGSALTIGGAGSNATVTLLASNQIANTTAVTVTSTSTTAMGVFNLNGFSDTIASLTMTASTVQGVLVTTGASGVLTVTGDITLNNNRNLNDASSNARNIVITGTGDIGTAAPNTGTLNLGGATRTITVQSTATGASIGNLDATIETVITNGGIIKEGDRALVLSANNTYTGATTVNNGELHLRNGSLAAGAVTVSETGGSLTNAAVLSGTGSIGGSVIIGEAGCGVGILAVGSVNSTTTLVSNYGAGANGTLELTAGGPALTVADGSQIQLGITNATYVSTGLAAVLASGAYTTAADYANANATEFSASWNVAPTSTSDMDFLNLSGSGSSLSIGDRASGTFGDGSVRVSGLSLAAPAYGQVFNLIDWKSASIIGGGFDTGGSSSYLALGNIIAGDLDLPTLGSGGWAWDVSLFASHGILVVVPEPSRALFLLLGLLGLMLRRRRR